MRIEPLRRLWMAVSAGRLATGGAADFGSRQRQPPRRISGRFPAPATWCVERRRDPPCGAAQAEHARQEHRRLPRRARSPYKGAEEPGTIVIAQSRQTLYFVEPDGKAMRYAVAVGAAQNQWTGVSSVTAVHLQPGWTAPESLRRGNTGPAPVYPSGSPDNPMGIGALTLSGGDYAIHGTNRPDSIGRAVSGGCFRMFNEDIADLMRRVRVGTRVVVQS